MEHWHPNPLFFYRRGGGPMLDMGPYDVTQLFNLIGPVRRVASQTSITSPSRTVSTEPLKGQQIEVEVATMVNGLLDMASALRSGRNHRASGEMALHALEVMEALLRSSDEGRHIDIESRAQRPTPLPIGVGEEVFLPS